MDLMDRGVRRGKPGNGAPPARWRCAYRAYNKRNTLICRIKRRPGKAKPPPGMSGRKLTLCRQTLTDLLEMFTVKKLTIEETGFQFAFLLLFPGLLVMKHQLSLRITFNAQ